jgi:hypothetical protein
MAQWASPYQRPMVMIEIACDNRRHHGRGAVTLPALIDTGSDTCSIPKTFADACGHVFMRGRPISVGGSTGRGEGRLHASALRLTGPGVEIGEADIAEEAFIPWTWTGNVCVCNSLKNFALLGLQDFLAEWDFSVSRTRKSFQLLPVSASAAAAVRKWRR